GATCHAHVPGGAGGGLRGLRNSQPRQCYQKQDQGPAGSVKPPSRHSLCSRGLCSRPPVAVIDEPRSAIVIEVKPPHLVAIEWARAAPSEHGNLAPGFIHAAIT